MKESQIQSIIIDYLIYLEGQGKLFFQRTNNTPIYQENRYRRLAKGQKKGFPDIILCYRGTFIGLEVKTETGKQSKEQKWNQRKIIDNGGHYFIVRSLDDVKEILEKLNEVL